MVVVQEMLHPEEVEFLTSRMAVSLVNLCDFTAEVEQLLSAC